MKCDSEEKVSFFASIRLRCIMLVLGCVLISAVVSYLTTVPKFSSQVSSEAKSNMLQMCTAYEKLIEQKVSSTGGMIETSQFKAILENVKIDGLDSSYFYLVSSNGTMLYHPEKDKVGEPVENESIKKVVDEIQNGNIPKQKVVTYKYNGDKKFAGYSIGKNSHMILVVAVDESDVYSKILSLAVKSIISQLIICLILVIIGAVVSTSITKPIERLCKILRKASALDFTDDEDMNALIKRRDEFGLIIGQYKVLQESLKDMIYRIGNASNNISASADEIAEVVHAVNEHSQDNSATSQQLAAGMQETAATVDTIDANVNTIQSSTSEINKKTTTGLKLADEIKRRADELEETTSSAIKKADRMFDSVKQKSNIAIDKSKAVSKINVLSNTIMEIADETSLLSINASIEAARAGEMGRGFGVVANEISNLANQSAETVSGITAIVTEVQEAVSNMAECLETSLTFFDESVRKDYMYFKNTSAQYNADAAQLQKSMNTIHNEIDELSKVTEQISTAVSGIAITVNEATVGVTDIAGKTTDVVGLVSETGQKINVNKKYSEDLRNIMNDFTI